MRKKIIIKPKKERDCTFSIRIDKDIHAAYEELSDITGYSRNELINIAMKHLLENLDIVTSDEKIKSRVAEFQEKYTAKSSFES